MDVALICKLLDPDTAYVVACVVHWGAIAPHLGAKGFVMSCR